MRAFKVYLATFLILVIATPCVLGAARENPVHEKRKAWREKRSEYYKGKKVVDAEEEKKAAEEKAKQEEKDKAKDKDKKADKQRKGYKDRLAELMKEFDKNSDGILSEEEMKAAKEAGKDRELQTLLNIEKSKKEKAKKAAKPEAGKEE